MNYILDPVLIHFEVYWTRAFFATPAYLVVNFQVQNVGFLLKREKYSNIRSKSAPVDHRQSDVYNKSSESFRPKTKYEVGYFFGRLFGILHCGIPDYKFETLKSI